MSRHLNKVYCQNCRAANHASRELCAHCGTRLLLISSSPTVRHEEGAAARGVSGPNQDEHLLERISALENNFTQLAVKVGETLDLMLRQVDTTNEERLLVETLLDTLIEGGALDRGRFVARWHRRRNKEALEDARRTSREALHEQIMRHFGGVARQEFARMVGDGLDLALRGETLQAAHVLEGAVVLDAHNARLNLLIGRLYYAAGQARVSRPYLERTLKVLPNDSRTQLMLGLVCAFEGDLKSAEEWLSTALALDGECFAARVGRGLLRVAEKDWGAAQSDFERAHAVKPGPASHFLLGYVAFAKNDFAGASAHLAQASVCCPEEPHALIIYTMGLAFLKAGEPDLAKTQFALAARIDPAEAQYKTAARRRRTAPPLPELFVASDKKFRLRLTEPARFISQEMVIESLARP